MAPSDPLDELAFLYFLRTAPLQPGRSYSYSRYFRTGYNPIQVWWPRPGNRWPLPDGKTVPALAVQVTSRGMIMKALADRRRAAGSRRSWRFRCRSGVRWRWRRLGSGVRPLSSVRCRFPLPRSPPSTSPDSYRSPTCSPAGCTAAPRSRFASRNRSVRCSPSAALITSSFSSISSASCRSRGSSSIRYLRRSR